MSARRTTAGAAVAALALVAAGCGGGGGRGPSSSATTAVSTGRGATLGLKADPGGALRFDKKTLAAKPGKVTIVLKNPAPLSHDVALEGAGLEEHGEVVGQGGTSTVSATLKSGTYTFYCSVPGHRQAGMHGTLTVR